MRIAFRESAGSRSDSTGGQLGRAAFPDRSNLWLILIIAIATASRVVTWALVPRDTSGWGGDEISYYRAAMRIILSGDQDLYWPPGTGWLIALLAKAMQTERLHVIRLGWVALDVCNVAMVFLFVRRIQDVFVVKQKFTKSAVAFFSALGYALYLPALAYATHATSEVLSAAFLLGALLSIDWVAPLRTGRMAIGGLLAGGMCLTRPALAPVVLGVVGALVLGNRRAKSIGGAVIMPCLVFVLVGATPSAFWIMRNYAKTGYWFLSLNLPHNAFRAARQGYQDDLRFVDSEPKPSEVKKRQANLARMFAGDEALRKAELAQSREERRTVLRGWLLQGKGVTPAEVFERRTDSLAQIDGGATNASLMEQLRRGVARLARSIAPKTVSFGLVQRSRPFGDATRVSLFVLTNVQWGIVLFFGVAGLVIQAPFEWRARVLLSSLVVGALVSPVFAHGEPRYTFPIEWTLLVSAAALFANAARSVAEVRQRRWKLAALIGIAMLLGTAWLAAARWGFAPSLRATW